MSQQTMPNVPGNFLQGLTGGLQAGQAVSEIQNQNALANLFQEKGTAMMQGDRNALNALAGIGPEGFQMAYDMRRQGEADERAEREFDMSMQLNEAQLDNVRQQMALRTSEEARRLSELELERERALVASALSSASAAYEQGPDAIASWAEQNASHLNEAGINPADVTYDTFPAVVAGIEGAQRGLSAGVELGRSFSQEPDRSAREEQIERIAQLPDPQNPGQPLGREMATLIADGVIKTSRNPTTEEVQLIDQRTGQQFTRGSTSQGPSQRPGGETSGSSLTASPGQDIPQSSSAARPGSNSSTSSGTLSFGEPYSDSENAFGVEGAFRRGVNALGDAVGLGPAFPDTLQTQRDFGVLRERIINDIASGYDRQPPSWLLQNIEELVPEAGRPFQGPEDAQSRLRSIGRDLSQEREQVAKSLKRRMSPEARQKLESQLSGLDAALGRLETALSSFGGNVNQEDIQLMQELLQDD